MPDQGTSAVRHPEILLAVDTAEFGFGGSDACRRIFHCETASQIRLVRPCALARKCLLVLLLHDAWASYFLRKK